MIRTYLHDEADRLRAWSATRPRKKNPGKSAIPVATRFYTKVVTGMTDCWIWVGAINDIGYGQFFVNKKQVAAHRFCYQEMVGPIPKGKLVLHTCDVRCCVNPDHLFLGTQSDNIKDMYRKGRGCLRRVKRQKS